MRINNGFAGWGIAMAAVVSLTTIFGQSTTHAQDTDAGTLVKEVKKSLNSIETFTCSFEWEHVWKLTERVQRMEGRLWMKKPYLLHMEDSSGRTVVIDGKNVWDYQPSNSQVQLHDFDGRGEQFPTPDQLFSRYAEQREAAYLGDADIDGSSCAVIELRPEKEEDAHITVWIDRKLKFPVKVLETAVNGDTTTHILHDVRLNEKLDKTLFTFSAPDGVETVDLRE